MSTSEIAKLETRWRDNPQGLTFAPLAEAYRKQRDPRRALDILQPGLERHPDYIPANIVLGRCHWDLSDFDAAERAFTHVLTLDSENVIALKALADITERQSRPHEAERWLETLLSVDRSNDEAREQLARIRAVQSVAPAVETPAGLDEPAVDSPPRTDTWRGVEEASAADARPEQLFDPFPSIADQIDRSPAEPEPEPAPAAWISEADDAAAEPAVFPDLADAMDEAAPSRPEPEPEVALPPDFMSFAGPPPPDVDVFGFERAEEEEIVLNVSDGSEFHTPSAVDDLMAAMAPADDSGREPEAELEPEQPVEGEPGLEVEHEPEPEPFESSLALDPPSPAALFGAYAPDDSAEIAEPAVAEAEITAPITAEAASAEVAAPAAPAAFEPPSAESLPAGEPPFPGFEPSMAAARTEVDAPAVAEPDLVVTETMAQVFLRQGHVVEALAVYRELAARSPDSDRLRERVVELEARQLAAARPAPQPSFLARDTGGQSLGSFFAALLAARPDRDVPPAAEGLGGVELSPDAAPATRPAQEPLSLGSVFGEDPPAVAPAVPPPGAAPAEPASDPAAAMVSFDDFFAGAQVPAPAPAAPIRPSRAKPEDDLDQFHTWLQGLKR